MTIKHTPPPILLGEVTITMPTESAIALAGLISGLPLGRIDTEIAPGESRLFSVFSALYEDLVIHGSLVRNELYRGAKDAVKRTIRVVRLGEE